MINKLKKILYFFNDLFFPPLKIYSREKIETFLNIKSYNNLYIFFPYKEKYIQKIIKELKFHRQTQIANILALIIYDFLLPELSDLENLENFKNPILIPIPMSKQKLKSRGFNQTELIAKNLNQIDKNHSFKIQSNLLIKKRNTPSQSLIKNKAERIKNINDSFKLNQPEKIKNQNIILLDDVISSGATIRAAEDILKKGGAKKVICLIISG